MAATFEFELQHFRNGAAWVAGVDEAGRGPLAGPVVAAAVALPQVFDGDGLNDSKKLSAAARRRWFDRLTNDAGVTWSIAEAAVEEIDSLNILRATWLAMRRAVEGLGLDCQRGRLLVDGRPVPGLPCEAEALVKGDGRSWSIAAASVLAKVHRDRLMLAAAERFPVYGFDRHKGYGTREHLLALERHGACELHRRSFAPVAAVQPRLGL